MLYNVYNDIMLYMLYINLMILSHKIIWIKYADNNNLYYVGDRVYFQIFLNTFQNIIYSARTVGTV